MVEEKACQAEIKKLSSGCCRSYYLIEFRVPKNINWLLSQDAKRKIEIRVVLLKKYLFKSCKRQELSLNKVVQVTKWSWQPLPP